MRATYSLYLLFVALILFYSPEGRAKQDSSLMIDVSRISEQGVHERKGAIYLRQMPDKLELVVELSGFPPGWHAVHIHENPSCVPALVEGEMVAGAGAGPHYDPTGVMQMNMDAMAPMASPSPVPGAGPADDDAVATGKPASPGMAMGEATAKRPPGRKPRPLGDLPAIYTGPDGKTSHRLLTYRLRLDELVGRSIMFHAFSEAPEDPDLPRGGGPRIACGVIARR